MTSDFLYFTGIDVSKDKVDIFSSEKSSHITVANSRKQIRQALYRFNREKTLIVLENTGGYENVCIDTLQKIGYKIHRANNNRVKNFIRYRGIKAKTDKIDAEALADYGKFTYNNKKQELGIYKQLSTQQKKIRETTFFIDNIKKFRAALKNRIKSPNCEAIKDSAKQIADFLNEQIENLEEDVQETIKEDKKTDEKCFLLMQYKGVGKTTAYELASFLPELGTMSNKAICALAGVAPHPKDSGKIRGYRTTKGGGRPIVRKVLFMAALSAVRYNKNLSKFYEKKLKDGKRKMVAITACMRKMLIQLNAISKKGAIDF